MVLANSQQQLQIEGQSCHRLLINAQLELSPVILPLFSNTSSFTKPAHLKFRASCDLTDAGIEEFANNYKGLDPWRRIQKVPRVGRLKN
ncbi:hypothetical protein PIB30_081353, partial [Stylosanthes scabra]|nr:hypothetical protein [Stylosanthes scabra]